VHPDQLTVHADQFAVPDNPLKFLHVPVIVHGVHGGHGVHGLHPEQLHALLSASIGHKGSVGLSVYKVHISATRWRLSSLTAVALRFCRATEKTTSSGRNKRRATAKSLNDLP
jgi:hypothetical protein